MLEKIAWARFFTVERIKNKVLCKKLLKSVCLILYIHSDVASANVHLLMHYLKYSLSESFSGVKNNN